MVVRVAGQIKKFNIDPLEKTLEAWLVARVRLRGGRAYKFTSPGHRSVPDRVILGRRRRLFFIEVKRYGKKATPKQKVEHDYLRSLGFYVYVCDSKESILSVLDKELPKSDYDWDS